MKIEDGTNRAENIKDIVTNLSDLASEDNYTFYEFGNFVQEVPSDSMEKINFTDGSTNLQSIVEQIKNSEKNIASVTIITDGVITSGGNPYYEALNLGIPFFTIGIGDTTQRKDVELKKIPPIQELL